MIEVSLLSGWLATSFNNGIASVFGVGVCNRGSGKATAKEGLLQQNLHRVDYRRIPDFGA